MLTIGYYIPKWYDREDAIISNRKRYDWMEYSINEINPKYRFCKLINNAKKRNYLKSESDKKQIIKILTKGLAWKLKKYDFNIINKIDFLVHVPKFDENYNGRQINNFNHGFYYAYYLSEYLNIPFLPDLIFENHPQERNEYERFEILKFPTRIKDRTFMIIDDIYTNGNTKGPIAELLDQYNAKEIYISTIGRTKH
ncbi:MAG: phosphoribosyltransferase [Promethearchaeia archaeon]